MTTLFELFAEFLPQPTILCMRKDGADQITILASKNGDQAWRNTQIAVNQAELYAFIDGANWAVAGRPVIQSGYIYQVFVHLDSPLVSGADLLRLVQSAAREHDRRFTVPPQDNVLHILHTIPETCGQATLRIQIEFSERLYTLTAWRYEGNLYAGVNGTAIRLDPLAFDSALQTCGWRQTQPPVHQTGDKYHILIERTSGQRFLVTDKTDVQDWRQREDGLRAHLVLQHA